MQRRAEGDRGNFRTKCRRLLSGVSSIELPSSCYDTGLSRRTGNHSSLVRPTEFLVHQGFHLELSSTAHWIFVMKYQAWVACFFVMNCQVRLTGFS